MDIKDEYYSECRLSKIEWELDRLADNIRVTDSSLERIGMLRSYTERICEEQRMKCHKNYKTKQAENIAEELREVNNADYEGKFYDLSKAVLNTPLLTDPDRPKCDECGRPLKDDELKAGTCEYCLCPE